MNSKAVSHIPTSITRHLTDRFAYAILSISITFLAATYTPFVMAEQRNDQTILRFSADDQVCVPLTASLAEIHRQHPEALYLGEVRGDLFKQSDVSYPHWMSTANASTDMYYSHVLQLSPADAVRQFVRQSSGDWSGGALLELSPEPSDQRRLVLVEQDSVGSHGDYQTTVMLLKPNVDFSKVDQLMSDKATLEVSDLTITFTLSRSSTVPIFDPKAHPSSDAKLLRNWLVGPVPQEPVVVHGATYFIAGMALHQDALVYEITPPATARVVCIMAPTQSLLVAKEQATREKSLEK